MEFKSLSWDSEFFGFAVGQLNGDPGKTSLHEIYKEMAAKNIRLAYYSSETEILFPQHPLYSSQLMDIKVTYIKDVVIAGCDENVQSYINDFPEEKLISLAVESGIYSRFKKDPDIPLSKYEELYKQWIVNSVNKKIADEVLVYETRQGIAGFVTVGSKCGRADIGIIAVDRNHRGHGIGKALMRSAENLNLHNYQSIQVVTQGANLPAIKLYESCGYVLEKVEYFYHLWKKP